MKLSNSSQASETTRLVVHKESDGKYTQPASNVKSFLDENLYVANSLGKKEDLRLPERDLTLPENTPSTPHPGTLKPIYCGTVLDKVFGNWKPGDAVLFSLMIMVTSSLAGMMLVSHYWEDVINGMWWTILLLTLLSLITITFLFVMCAHQQNDVCVDDKAFRVGAILAIICKFSPLTFYY